MFSIYKGCKDADLAACIESFYIGCRVFLCVAQLLRHFESVLKGHILSDHLCQDKIRGAVEDACDFDHIICRKTLTQRTDDRHAAANACFKEVVDIMLLCDPKQLSAFCRYQLFVGRYHAFAAFEQPLCKIICRIDAAHHFGNDLHFIIVQNIIKRLGKLILKRAVGKITDI